MTIKLTNQLYRRKTKFLGRQTFFPPKSMTIEFEKPVFSIEKSGLSIEKPGLSIEKPGLSIEKPGLLSIEERNLVFRR